MAGRTSIEVGVFQLPLIIDEKIRAWVAGFIDGEGCIRIERRNRISRKKTSIDPRKFIQHGIRVSVVNKNIEALERIRMNYGGHIFRHTLNKEKNHAQTYTYVLCSSGRVIRLLKDIEPFCIVKSGQIKVAMEFIASVRQSKKEKLVFDGYQGQPKMNANIFDFREGLVAKMSKLNARGKGT